MKKGLIVLMIIFAINSVCSILMAEGTSTPAESTTRVQVKDKPALNVSGTITGFVKGIVPKKDAVVYIEKIDGEFPAPEAHAVMHQIGLAFAPHVLPIMKGTTVDFPDSDFFIEVEPRLMLQTRLNPGDWTVGELRHYTFNKQGVAVILCRVHPDLEGLIVVLQNPFFDKTREDGKFTIEGVPPGEYTINVWHKRHGMVSQNIVVSAGETTAVDFAFNKRKKAEQ